MSNLYHFSSIEKVINALESQGCQPRKSGTGHLAKCPAHDDQNPSLSVTENRDGKVLVNCHAGCAPEAVLDALGLDWADLFPDGGDTPPARARTQQGKQDAVYPYFSESGELLYEVVRYRNPKTFRQRRPDGNGGYVWKLDGVDRVLYRLPELREAVAAEPPVPVLVTEGEKDADNLCALGFVATTAAGGAGAKWLPQYSESIRGADVVIVPDNDRPGGNYRDKIGEALQGTALSVRVLTVPEPHKDVSDWIKAGAEAADIQAAIDTAPEWKPPAATDKAGPVLVNLADVEAKAVSFLWEPYIPRGKITIVEGNPGMGKTSLVLKLAAHLTRGELLPGETGSREPANVIYLTCEDGIADTIKPRFTGYGGDSSRFYVLQNRRVEDPDTGNVRETLITLQDLSDLASAIETVRPVLVVIDPVQAFLGPKVDMNKANEVRPVMASLGQLAETYDFAVVLIRHLGQSGKDRAIFHGIGSIDFSAVARSILLTGTDPQDEAVRVVAHLKHSCSAKGKSHAFGLPEGVFTWMGESDLTEHDLVAAAPSRDERTSLDDAVEFLEGELAEGPEPAEELLRRAEKLGIPERTLRRAQRKLGVMANRESSGNGGAGRWIWRLCKAA